VFSNNFRGSRARRNINISCDILRVPYTALPAHMFEFITSTYGVRTDQVVLSDG
jgi:hypothetical protein